MVNRVALLVSILCVISISCFNFSGGAYAQTQPLKGPSSNILSNNANAIVSVNSSLTIQVSNDTIDTNQKTLRSAMINFLNSGPGVLKSSDKQTLVVKSKIVNQINSDTQNVEGIEATNAIIGVEITKALGSTVSSQGSQGGSKAITVQTSSTCQPTSADTISCSNDVILK